MCDIFLLPRGSAKVLTGLGYSKIDMCYREEIWKLHILEATDKGGWVLDFVKELLATVEVSTYSSYRYQLSYMVFLL